MIPHKSYCFVFPTQTCNITVQIGNSKIAIIAIIEEPWIIVAIAPTIPAIDELSRQTVTKRARIGFPGEKMLPDKEFKTCFILNLIPPTQRYIYDTKNR